MGLSYDKGGYEIDLPQVQGAIYVESCVSCLLSYGENPEGCDFCSYLQHAEIVISNNEFKDNSDDIPFYKEHNLDRAS